MPKINCAIYVRKSTEHGLDQEFNSLHNQEDACKAYIASQAFNEWKHYKTYTDGGISGGTMERPGLKQMLDDMSRGLIQIVIVYKVDRLSRSIMDFHNMMKEFDKYNCNFVSITQAFDTSTSMGKLTLNMLLSFAQFEREVSSERVRDKICASKAKGMWTGGIPWLGYDIVNKKQVINPTEAEQVRHIFESYLQINSIIGLAQYLKTCGITAKKWVAASGEVRGGRPISTTSLQRLLTERIYIGQIEHKRNGTCTKGEHQAIIAEEIFNAVQERMRENSNGKSGRSNGSPNLLSGKLFDSDGTRFSNQTTAKKRKSRQTYYAVKGLCIPALTVDKIVTETIVEFLDADFSKLPADITHAIKQINYNGLDYLARRALTKAMIEKVIYAKNQLTFFIRSEPATLKQFMTENTLNQNCNPMDFIIDNDKIIITKPVVFNRGIYSNKYNAGRTGLMTITENNHLIIRAFATAWKFRKLYEEIGNLDTIVENEKTSYRTLYRYLNIAYMSPDKVNEIMSGRIQYNLNELFEIATKHSF